MKSSKEIRKQFIDFFVGKEHKEVRSAPVIPIDDPTLLFTNAGMNQFKEIFLGLKKPELKRAVDSQKCIRAGGKHNDLEEVGKDGYHHTLFEMLGNWSFADYYKKEAIQWAWELLTDVWELPKDKLYASVYKDDQEAFELWKEVTDIDHSHILYFGDKDNFWEMAETGPCGPCSEIHIDLGEDRCMMKNIEHECAVNGDCHRFIELWNLVFIQYNREKDGSLTPLKNKYVDTGAGFERICQVLQGVGSNYETDLFMPIINKVAEISAVEYKLDETGVPHRVIADHIRALSFSIADGGMPSNEGRGYVMRRILRRAARFGRLLNLKKPFLHEIVDTFIEVMGDHFTELKEKRSHIKLIIKAEEERFNLTLDNGLQKFDEIIQSLEGKIISGKDIFTLYDTYGFPVDLSKILAEEKRLEIDETGFNKEMEKQRQRARESAKFKMNSEKLDWIQLRDDQPTEFAGYNELTTQSKIIKYNIDDKNNIQVVLDKTPFYGESGGQVADTGKIYNDECEIVITDVQKFIDQFIHYGQLVKGEVNDEEFTCTIEKEYRKSIARNHTATHLLHAALRETLVDHVQQKGSLVHPDHLRFDFTHFKQVSPRELEIIEKIVNTKIRECLPVQTDLMNIDEAKKKGAMALFGEKYDDRVRVVSIEGYSMELCGGTHLTYTGEIGVFKILSESSIAAGIRRIEAVTGAKAEEIFRNSMSMINGFSKVLNAPPKAVFDKLMKLVQDNKKLQKKLDQKSINAAANSIDNLLVASKKINGIRVVSTIIETDNPGKLRQIGDQLKDKMKSGIGVLFSKSNNKVSILATVTKDLTGKYKAGKIVNEIAQIVGGKGGGRPDMAMAGGKDVTKINTALKAVEEVIKKMGEE